MPWEDAYWSHTGDNRFTNTSSNAWFGIHTEIERDFTSKGISLAAPREVGGGAMGFGKRPYLHDSYAEMLKSTTDKEAFDRLAMRGYFPGRAMLERPYGSKHYQEMKYQKPVSPLMAQTPPELEILGRPEFDIPTGFTMENPMWMHGYVCLTNVSRLKVCVVDDGTTEGIEIYDGISNRYTKEALLTTGKRFNILIYNIYQIRQTSPYVYIFIHDGSSWRKCTSTECGGRICGKIEAMPGKEVWGAYDCWLSYFDNTRWETGSGYGSWDAANSRWEADQVPGYSWYRFRPFELGTWVEGYKPDYLRVTFSGVTTLTIYLRATDNTWIVAHSCYLGTGATSGEILLIDWSGVPSSDDIYYLYCYTDDCPLDAVFYVTNIEFQ